jgi:hypothetical protein
LVGQVSSGWAGRVHQGDDEEEIPYLPLHLESRWIILATSPWNIAFDLMQYLRDGLFVDMWDFKVKLCVRPAKHARACCPLDPANDESPSRRRRSSATITASRDACRTTQ